MAVRDEQASSDVWILDLARGIPTRTTFDPSTDWFPAWTPDGAHLIFGSTRDGAPTMYVKSATGKVQGRFSPDGRFVAYASDESGQFEVYVQAFQSGTERKPISVGGGMQPEWRRDGREIFYLSRDRKIMAVPIAVRDKTIDAGTPQPLFGVDVVTPTFPYPNDYAVSADGQRFLVNSVEPEPNRQALTVVLNWPAALKPR